MNILTKTFTKHKKAATVGVIAAALVLTTGVGVACKGYIDNQAQVKKQAIENQKKLENEKIAKQAAEEEAKKKAAAEEAANAAAASQQPAETKPVSETAPKPAVTTKPKPTSESKPKPTATGDVTSISLMLASGTLVKWQTNGYSDKGFKVVWSKTSGPTYPTRATDKYQYLSDPASYKTNISAFDGPGTYYVRVCEYLGGACGVYSNQITVSL